MMGDSSDHPPLCLSEMGFREMDVQKIAFSYQLESSKTDTSDSFVVDIESLSHGMVKDMTTNSSRISVKLQRNLSRKGSTRGERNKSNSVPKGSVAEGSPKASLNEGSIPRKTGMAPLVSPRAKDEPISILSEQIITITAESRCRRFCKNRNYAWFMDPRQIKHGDYITYTLHSPSASSVEMTTFTINSLPTQITLSQHSLKEGWIP